MRELNPYEKKAEQERQQNIAAHRWRMKHWEEIKHNFIPEGLTCVCGADHCEVDGHAC